MSRGMDSVEWLLVGLGAFVALLLGVMIWAAVVEENQWQAFKATHDCKVVGKTTSTTSTGFQTVIGPNGQVGMGPVTTVTPSKTGWLCNDGVTYWR